MSVLDRILRNPVLIFGSLTIVLELLPDSPYKLAILAVLALFTREFTSPASEVDALVGETALVAFEKGVQAEAAAALQLR